VARTEPPSIPPRLQHHRAIALIKRQIERLDEIVKLRWNDPKIDAWESTTENILNDTFGMPGGERHRNTEEFALNDGRGYSYAGMPDIEFQNNFLSAQQRRRALLEAFIEQLEDLAPSSAATTPENDLKVWQGKTHSTEQQPGILVFISYSSKDALQAEALIELLTFGLGLTADQIRCAGVDGYRLPAGANTPDQLRHEIISAKVVIGLLTPNSLSSTYVLFELGARWGAKKFMIPLLAGVSPEEMRGPHAAFNALSCETEQQLIQLVEDAGRELGISPQSVASYLDRARRVKQLAQSISAPLPVERVGSQAISKPSFRLSIEATGRPPSQVLKLTASQSITVSRLEYMLSDETCIVAEDLSREGQAIEVPLNQELLTRLFNLERPDMSYDRSGPVKLGLTVSKFSETQQYILPARIENLTEHTMSGRIDYRKITGSKTYVA
jgi:hypothetical protein